MKRRAACAILDLVPAPVAARFFATGSLTAQPIKAAGSVGSNASNAPSSLSERRHSEKPASLNLDVGISPSAITPPSSSLSKPHPPNDEFRIPDSDSARELQLHEIERTLDVFGDKYMNKHLLYAIVELVVVTLVPELAERRVEELMAERLAGLEVEGGQR